LVIRTGRSQGYADCIAQCLGLNGKGGATPLVIENGSALYYPDSKKIVHLTTEDQRAALALVREALKPALPTHTFEPKAFMLTINPEAESVDELRQKVDAALKAEHLEEKVSIKRTSTAVDITPAGVDKVSGLKEVLYRGPGSEASEDLRLVVLGAHSADLDIFKMAGRSPQQRHHGTAVSNFSQLMPVFAGQ
jgi:hydroxymethylpyrimidine pyrophosphatase-like HAD family hydrolase